MRIPLIGQSYTSFSPAAAAQDSVNIYPEAIEVPGEKMLPIAETRLRRHPAQEAC
jgi:hypothetical protein